ncbi:hypothetical protein PG994_013419 [Apiospora phragmitis]|uniref:Uncharacterized protein n=1 Tax=Apiospora phragmitis TaxID=2905665 RepID=A0ABR1TAA9_9PEZI
MSAHCTPPERSSEGFVHCYTPAESSSKKPMLSTNTAERDTEIEDMFSDLRLSDLEIKHVDEWCSMIRRVRDDYVLGNSTSASPLPSGTADTGVDRTQEEKNRLSEVLDQSPECKCSGPPMTFDEPDTSQ